MIIGAWQATIPSMQKQGTVVKWDDARGFGFIRSAGSSGDVFVHVRDFRASNGGTPRQGMAVTFEEIHVGGKGPRAMAVRPADEAASAGSDNSRQRSPKFARSRSHRGDSAPASGAAFALPLMAAYGAAIGWAVWTRQLPWWVLPSLFVINLFTFYAYMQDKYAASQNAWRISEGTLHIWGLVGGWPAAWFAQQLLRHKSRKKEFRSVYWATVLLHCAAVGGWFVYLR
jgi:uncharacterized membrane protein YsdA (DUF1294 family)/cold shock CspA family protein